MNVKRLSENTEHGRLSISFKIHFEEELDLPIYRKQTTASQNETQTHIKYTRMPTRLDVGYGIGRGLPISNTFHGWDIKKIVRALWYIMYCSAQLYVFPSTTNLLGCH